MDSYRDALPRELRSHMLDTGNGLVTHTLEAGDPRDPAVLLLHGFPELAYSWRKVMAPIAARGFHVIAPDQRGYGLSTGWDGNYDGDLVSYRLLNLVRDTLGLVRALGHQTVAAVVGHDFGSRVAASCALVRPDIFRAVVMMSAPFAGAPAITLEPDSGDGVDIHTELAALDPPRKHYQWYYSTRSANQDMWHCPQGVHDFLRAYFHYKSADWKDNKPHTLRAWRAAELAILPHYYIMEQDKDMAQTAAEAMPSPAEVASCGWLNEQELGVYAAQYEVNGFQGGLQWYRCATGRVLGGELEIFDGRTIDVPSCYIAGRSDWGTFQKPGEYQAMQEQACTRMLGAHLVAGAGHWVQQEQPQAVVDLLVQFLADSARL